MYNPTCYRRRGNASNGDTKMTKNISGRKRYIIDRFDENQELNRLNAKEKKVKKKGMVQSINRLRKQF